MNPGPGSGSATLAGVEIFGNIYNIYFSKHSAQRHEKDVHSFYRTLGANRFVCRYRDCAAAFDKEADQRLHCKAVHKASIRISYLIPCSFLPCLKRAKMLSFKRNLKS
jgi:hypothetical protein